MTIDTDIFFYKLSGFSRPNLWFTNWNGVAINEWCHEHGIKYKTEYFDGFKTGILLLDEKDQTYFYLRWGGKPSRGTPYANEYWD